ncbi:hypothetical protein NL676_011289 [Syzygium grande]|nr:hypothetical protein NL676_011289 [Syzygium grande]
MDAFLIWARGPELSCGPQIGAAGRPTACFFFLTHNFPSGIYICISVPIFCLLLDTFCPASSVVSGQRAGENHRGRGTIDRVEGPTPRCVLVAGFLRSSDKLPLGSTLGHTPRPGDSRLPKYPREPAPSRTDSEPKREPLVDSPLLDRGIADLFVRNIEFGREQEARGLQQSPCLHLLPVHELRVPAVKFSDDTERLKYINGIRKAPVGAQMKRVIDLLYESRLAFTPEQINESCYVDMLSNKAVFDSLANNPKVHYDGQRFSYKSKHDVKDKNQLLKLIRSYTEGIAVIDLKDAYPTVIDDLQALKAAGQVWLLSNFDSQEDIAYPNDPKVPIKVDDDLKQLFRSIELPRDMIDIEKDLQKNGMKPSTNTTQRRLAAQIHGDFAEAQDQEEEARDQQEDEAHQRSSSRTL